jgi:acetylornithine/N-succinyldiaminopimelate aminotransferase
VVSNLLPTYARADLAFERGEGAWLISTGGERYLDFGSGVAVNVLGHAHPVLVEALTDQAQKVWHVSNLFRIPEAERLAERLCAASFADVVFFCNSGAEAMECAIKTARKYQAVSGHPERVDIITYEGAFHGRTLATIAATPKLAREDLFGPLPAGFVAVPRDDPSALRQAVGEHTAAVMAEPIQGEAGIVPIADEVLVAAREACDAAGALLIFDEIQCGMGRTGSLWAYEQLPVRPDVMTAAKALGGGLPVGACGTIPGLGDVLELGDHGSTFGGGPVAAAAALAALDVIDDPELLRRARETGARFMELLGELDAITQVRGRGLIVGVTLGDDLDAAEAAGRALESGLVINVPGPGMLRFLPPLVIGDEEVETAIKILRDVLP